MRKDLKPGWGEIYGSDVELGPVRQDVQATEENQDAYDDLPFDMPEGIGQ